MMRRRAFLGVAGSALAVEAQAQRIHTIAILSDRNPGERTPAVLIGALREGLARLGWVEGRNLRILTFYAGGEAPRIRAAAAEIVAAAPDLVLTSGAPNTAAVQAVTRSLPIVFVQVADPVGSGLVPSLSATGGNTTGFTHFEFTMVGKWLALLKEIAPDIAQVMLMQGPTNPAWPGWRQAGLGLAGRFGVEVLPAPVEDAGAITAAMERLAQRPKGGLIVLPDTITSNNNVLVVELAARHRIPAIYPFRSFIEAGGLMAYGPDVPAVWGRAATYVDRILRGEKPGDLPVQAPTGYDLMVNVKTAQALGLTVPPTLLASATEVIE
jgi:putative tryptophan/tyrosine transport system substrate-binding protein